jgi:nicotinate-nucleotide adenylyltransferase
MEEHKRIGIMGGTFDPIHYGHLLAAETALYDYGLESVIFVPTGHPPHKPAPQISSREHRYNMTLLAILESSEQKHFDISRIELERPGFSYTADTLAELRKIYGKNIYFIIGADSMTDLLKWKSPERIFDQCTMIVMTRPGINRKNLDKDISAAKSKYAAKLFISDLSVDISSTEIRLRAQVDRSLTGMVPQSVIDYINKYRLYKEDDFDLKTIAGKISLLMSDKRWRHTVGVINEAILLAERYGVNRRKAYIAALFHDCAKEMPSEQKRLRCAEWGIVLDEITDKQIGLAHGQLGAEIARREFNIDDPEILNAIRFHPTGSENMSLMDKILIVADCVEENRKNIKGLDDIRAIKLQDLEKSLILCFQVKINFTLSKKESVHPITYKALAAVKGDNIES